MFSQLARGWSFAEFMIALIVIVGCAAILWIVVRASNLPIPPWVWQVIGVVILVFVGIMAIRLIISM